MRKLLTNKQAGVLTGVVTLLIAVVIGLLVWWSISGGLTGLTMNTETQGQTARTAINNTATTIFTLAPIVGIVAVAALFLAYVSRFGAEGGL